MDHLNRRADALEHLRDHDVGDHSEAGVPAPQASEAAHVAALPDPHHASPGARPPGDADPDPEDHAALEDASLSALGSFFAARGVDVDLASALRSKYIHSARDARVSGAMDACLKKLAERRRNGAPFEGRGVAVVAESGAGKSECVRRALERHPIFSEKGINNPGSRAVSVVCMGSCTLRILGEAILEACGYKVQEGLRENEVWRLVRHHLRLLGILLVHVDEVSNLTDNAHDDDRQRIVNNLKALINNPDWPVVLLVSGIPSIGPVLRRDPQLSRRLRWIELKPLRSPEDNSTLAAFAGALCVKAEIASPRGFENTIAPRLAHAACCQLGLAAECASRPSSRRSRRATGRWRPATSPPCSPAEPAATPGGTPS